MYRTYQIIANEPAYIEEHETEFDAAARAIERERELNRGYINNPYTVYVDDGRGGKRTPSSEYGQWVDDCLRDW